MFENSILEQYFARKLLSRFMFHVKTKHEHYFDILAVLLRFTVFTLGKSVGWMARFVTPRVLDRSPEPVVGRAEGRHFGSQ